MTASEARAGGATVDVAEFIDGQPSAGAVFLAAAAAALCASLAAFGLGRLVRASNGGEIVEQATSLRATLNPASGTGH
jgi:hypothetical protein